MTHPFRTALVALALIACAWLPGTASAQGVLMGSADLDGDTRRSLMRFGPAEKRALRDAWIPRFS